jgi:predicted permease
MLTDLKQALRGIRQNPAFTALCATTLALGIGLSAAVFSVVNGVLLEPLRFPRPDRIVSINTRNANRVNISPRMTGGDFVDVRRENQVFQAIGSYFGGEMGVQVRGHAEFAGTWFVNAGMFQAAGLTAAAGRLFADNERTAAVVSEGFAARNFEAAAQAIGARIEVENRAYEIAGVIAGATFPAEANVWLPAPYTPPNLVRSSYNYRAIARLKDGISLQKAQADLDAIAAQLAAAYPNTNKGRTFPVVQLREQLTGPVRTTLYILLSAVMLVLLIACANVSNLLLARSAGRCREVAVRTAIGASRAHIVRQLLLESLAVALCGGAMGVGLAFAGTHALLRFAPANLPRLSEIHVDLRVVGFAFAVSLLSALIFGLAPAWQTSQVDLATAVKQGAARGVLGGGSHRLRNSLVVAEIALSFVLVTGAGLLFRSFMALNSADNGFRRDRILVMNAHAPASSLAQYVGVGRMFVDNLLPAVSQLPGVQSAGAVMGLPTGAIGSNGSYAVEGQHTFATADNPGSFATEKMPESIWALPSPNYFETMGIPLLRGRDFNARDQYEALPVAIVSESLVRQSFPNENPIGKRIQCGLDRLDPMTIVGVVGDVRQDSPAAAVQPMIYMPLEQHPFHSNELQVVVRTSGPAAQLTAPARKVAESINSTMALKFTTMDTMVANSIAAPRFRTFLITIFAALALMLAVLGIYGVMSYIVSQRTAELGLRMALGAESGDVLQMVLLRAARLAAIGLVLGAALSIAAGRAIGSLLFGLKPTDPTTWISALAGVALIAVMAAAVPAWRASRIDPMVALRQE